MSCASAGNCSAGGFYAGPSGQGKSYVFVVTEKGGRWGPAEQVPGSAALNKGGYGGLDSVSCASAGNCSAGGFYGDGSGHEQAFVVNETDGTWRKAQKVPDSAALNQDGYGGLGSVSCASAGNCSASGYYTDGSGHYQAFVVGETHGSWGTAEQVPGTAALNKGGFAGVSSLSCTSAGNCSGGGLYEDASGNYQAFIVSETNGSWGTAGEVAGTAALNQGGAAAVSPVSCAAAGQCSAGGSYKPHIGDSSVQVFVVSQTASPGAGSRRSTGRG